MKIAWTMFAAATVLSFGQTTGKQPSAPPAKPNSWERSKECAAQAEKVVAGWYVHPDGWQNHYSPKYEKCFVKLTFVTAPSNGPMTTSVVLVDAFERAPVANIRSAGTEKAGCTVSEEAIDCAKAFDYVSERMKN